MRNRSLAIGAAAVILAGCGEDHRTGHQPTVTPTATVPPAATATATASPTPTTPQSFADLSEEISGGIGVFIGEARPPKLEEAGYVQHEYVASGMATSYNAIRPLPGDGLWTF